MMAAKSTRLFLPRLQNVYGPGQSLANPYSGVLLHFIKQALYSDDIKIYENGGNTRDFVYIDDVVKIFDAAIADDKFANVLNVGSGVGTALEELVQTIVDITKSSSRVSLVSDFRIGDVRHAKADMKRMKCINPDFQVTVLREGLKRTIRWVSQRL